MAEPPTGSSRPSSPPTRSRRRRSIWNAARSAGDSRPNDAGSGPPVAAPPPPRTKFRVARRSVARSMAYPLDSPQGGRTGIHDLPCCDTILIAYGIAYGARRATLRKTVVSPFGQPRLPRACRPPYRIGVTTRIGHGPGPRPGWRDPPGSNVRHAADAGWDRAIPTRSSQGAAASRGSIRPRPLDSPAYRIRGERPCSRHVEAKSPGAGHRALPPGARRTTSRARRSIVPGRAGGAARCSTAQRPAPASVVRASPTTVRPFASAITCQRSPAAPRRAGRQTVARTCAGVLTRRRSVMGTPAAVTVRPGSLTVPGMKGTVKWRRSLRVEPRPSAGAGRGMRSGGAATRRARPHVTSSGALPHRWRLVLASHAPPVFRG